MLYEFKQIYCQNSYAFSTCFELLSQDSKTWEFWLVFTNFQQNLGKLFSCPFILLSTKLFFDLHQSKVSASTSSDIKDPNREPTTPEAMSKLPDVHRAEYQRLKQEIVRREQKKNTSSSKSGTGSGTASPDPTVLGSHLPKNIQVCKHFLLHLCVNFSCSVIVLSKIKD